MKVSTHRFSRLEILNFWKFFFWNLTIGWFEQLIFTYKVVHFSNLLQMKERVVLPFISNFGRWTHLDPPLKIGWKRIFPIRQCKIRNFVCPKKSEILDKIRCLKAFYGSIFNTDQSTSFNLKKKPIILNSRNSTDL